MIVIGGGIVGVSTALWLQRMGADVTVVDRSGWGKATSAGNGGILAACAMVPVTGPGLAKKAPWMLLDKNFPLFMKWRYLPTLLPWLRKFLSHANVEDTHRIADGLAHLVADSVAQHDALADGTDATDWIIKTDYSYAYQNRAAFDADAFSWAIRKKHGFDLTMRDGADVQAFDPSLADNIRLLATMGAHGFIKDPAGYVAALGAEFEDKGGTLVTGDVTDFDMSDGKIKAVVTSQGRMRCDHAVLTTGVWSKPLMKKLGLNIPLESERGYHIVFRNAKGGPNHPIMLAAGKFVATPMEAGLRCAGTVEFGGLDAGPSKAPFAFLRKCTKDAFPNMTWDDEIEWQGHRPSTSDSLPLIGQIRETGIYAGFGHHHIGLTAGPKTGRLLAQLIAGQPPNIDLTPYAPARFA